MTRSLNPKAQWLLDQLARNDLSELERKRMKNRLKVTANRSIKRNTGHYSFKQYDALKRGRKLRKASKRRNRG